MTKHTIATVLRPSTAKVQTRYNGKYPNRIRMISGSKGRIHVTSNAHMVLDISGDEHKALAVALNYGMPSLHDDIETLAQHVADHRNAMQAGREAGPVARRVSGIINRVCGPLASVDEQLMADELHYRAAVVLAHRSDVFATNGGTMAQLTDCYWKARNNAWEAGKNDAAVTTCQIYNLTGIDIYLGKSHPAIKSITWHPAKVEAEKPYAHLSEVARHGETPAFILFRTQEGKRELCEGGVHTQPRTAATECAELNSRYPSITAFRYFVSDSLVGVEPIDGDVWASLFDEQRGIISMAHTPLWRQAVAAYGPAHGVEPCPECGNDDCTCPAPWTGPYSVAIALQDRAYGGPEEGGWYYTCGEVCPEHADKLRGFASEADAIAYARELNDSSFLAELNEGRRPISSVLSEGRYVAHVFDGLPANYPATASAL